MSNTAEGRRAAHGQSVVNGVSGLELDQLVGPGQAPALVQLLAPLSDTPREQRRSREPKTTAMRPQLKAGSPMDSSEYLQDVLDRCLLKQHLPGVLLRASLTHRATPGVVVENEGEG